MCEPSGSLSFVILVLIQVRGERPALLVLSVEGGLLSSDWGEVCGQRIVHSLPQAGPQADPQADPKLTTLSANVLVSKAGTVSIR